MKLTQIMDIAQYNDRYFKEVTTKVKSISLKHEGGYDYTGSVNISHRNLDISLYAMRQLLEKLGIKIAINSLDRKFPPESTHQRTLFDDIFDEKYLSKPEIIKEITKLGIRNQGNPYKLIYDNNKNIIVGVVGENYQRIPHANVLETAMEVYSDDIDPRFSFINDRYMRVFINSEDERITPITNQKIRFGYSIGNSETGWASLSVKQGLMFLACANGLEMGRIEAVTRLYHTIKELFTKFEKALQRHLKDESILNLIDEWATKPAMYEWDELKNPESLKKLDSLLSRFGVNREKYRQEIMNIIRKEDRTKPMNSFLIGSAVNNYASNHLDNAVEAQALISSAYQVMNIQ